MNRIVTRPDQNRRSSSNYPREEPRSAKSAFSIGCAGVHQAYGHCRCWTVEVAEGVEALERGSEAWSVGAGLLEEGNCDEGHAHREACDCLGWFEDPSGVGFGGVSTYLFGRDPRRWLTIV